MDFVNVDLVTTNDGNEAEYYQKMTESGVRVVRDYSQLLLDEGRPFVLDGVGQRETMEQYLAKFERGCRTYNLR